MKAQREILLIFLFTSALIGASFYLQWVVGLEPCPLCIIQRLCLFVICVVAFVGLLHRPPKWGKHVYGGGLAFFSTLGLLAALRQLWMQTLPATSLEKLNCAPSLNFMLTHMPLKETLQHVLWSSGECAEVTWTLLGGSIATWASLGFGSLCLLSFVLIFRQLKSKNSS